MISIHFLLISYQFVSSLQSAYSKEKPLIFDPYTLEIYDFGDKATTYKAGPYAVACPATDKHEIEFNERFSLNHKSLFVRHYSNKKDSYIYRIRCKSGVELAIAYHTHPITKKKYLKLGYEVYYVKSRHPETFNKASLYSNFERVLKPAMNHRNDFIFGSATKTPLIREDDTPAVLEMGFIWISKISFQFIKPEWRIYNLSYVIHKKVHWPEMKCLDEMYKKWSMDYVYSPQHQKEIFNSVQLPEDDCESKTNCVKKYSLVPAYQLQSSDSEPVLCTNYTTFPIWSKTAAPLLDYLNKFLFALAQVIDRNLFIFPKVMDTLKLPTNDGISPKLKHMYLYPEMEKIVIPKLILNLVLYRTYDCNIKEFLCWFHAIIVIHNEPRVTQKLCDEDECEQLGWANIQYQDKDNPRKKSQHIYCCKMNENLKEILIGSMTKTFFYEDLDLKNFPRYNKDTNEHEYEDKQKQIEDIMNQWVEGNESSETQNSWTTLPFVKDKDYLDL